MRESETVSERTRLRMTILRLGGCRGRDPEEGEMNAGWPARIRLAMGSS
jgi:hypothetical protein